MKTETNLGERVNNWMKHSVTLKLFSITILILLLLIPSTMIKSIMRERESLSQEAIDEVSSKWADRQEIAGPVLTIPIIYEYKKDEDFFEETKYWKILPESLNISGNVNPKSLRRGIYEIIVYESQLTFDGTFKLEKLDSSNIKEIRFDKAFLTVGLSDLRGIKDQVSISWNDKILNVEPGTRIPELIYSGFTIDLPDIKEITSNPLEFNFKLNFQGSQNLSFTPVGSTTKVKLNSSWESPSFNGNFLPDKRNISKDGFTAEWHILQLNRNYPQSWVGDLNLNKKNTASPYLSPTSGSTSALHESSFGAELILPLGDYQKSMRSAKYAVMTIGLTFLIFFLVEILHGRKIHAFQYTLVGLSLCLFYILLISISEHSNFNIAYGISMFSIITMITLYSLSVFKVKKISVLLTAVLIGIYSFLFVTLQLADYALLMGSIGLMAILGATMYFTRNVDWYQISASKE